MQAGLEILTVLDDARPSEEGALIEQSRAGLPDAFGLLYERYRQQIFQVCLGQLKDAARAEDAMHDTFLRALATLERFDTRKRMLPWLISIAVNRCIDMKRRDSKLTAGAPEDSVRRVRLDPDPTVASVISAEDRVALERALAKLPWRQRRTVLLYALEGWSYADIASAEGLSVQAAKALLCRARSNLRRSYPAGVLGILPLGLRRVKVWAQSRVVARRAGFEQFSMSATLQAISTAVVMLGTSVMNPGGATFGALPAAVPHVVIASSAHGAPPSSNSRSGARKNVVSAINETALARSARSAKHDLLTPTSDATPENTQFQSFAASPNFNTDHTIFAAGQVWCLRGALCSVLFVTHDAGKEWSLLPAQGFLGNQVLLPPDYPTDSRIYAMGSSGLQESDDGGVSFTKVTPLVGDAAISPLFGASDPRIVIGTNAAAEYWADKHLVKPAPLTVGSPVGLTLAFSPDYAKDNVMILGGNAWSVSKHQFVAAVWRCDSSLCQSTELPFFSAEAPQVRVSPNFREDQVVFVLADRNLLRSTDGGRTFDSLMTASGSSYFADLGFADKGMVYVVRHGRKGVGSVVLASRDHGTTWVARSIGVHGFEAGGRQISVVTPGRLLAAGYDKGLACSIDGGVTWRNRCSA